MAGWIKQQFGTGLAEGKDCAFHETHVWKSISENVSSGDAALPTLQQITLDNWFYVPINNVMAVPLSKSTDISAINSVGAATTSLDSTLSGNAAEYTGSLDATIDNSGSWLRHDVVAKRPSSDATIDSSESSSLSTDLWMWETEYWK
jgi:hypothetical protein